jgi:hypothetical protein
MEKAINRMKALGINTPNILVPRPGTDLKKWAVVACDQYTSEQEYWQRVEEYVGDAPSTLHLVYPEVYLEEKYPEKRIENINTTMKTYLHNQLFEEYFNSFFLLHRNTGQGPGRWGLIVALDLEFYDYNPDSKTPIRATEGTILSRIPPRKLIRKEAQLELPHILVLINDEERSIIEPLVEKLDDFEQIYDTELMENGGHIRAFRIIGKTLLEELATAFETLQKSLNPQNPLMFAMGDGNHSLATAKSCWEDLKRTLPKEAQANHPSRYAMVELENIFDPGLVFTPIHRVLFNCDRTTFLNELAQHCNTYQIEETDSISSIITAIENQSGLQRFGYVDSDGLKIISMTNPKSSIPAGTLQSVIDNLIDQKRGIQVDYIHGSSVTKALGLKEGNIGLFLPAIDKKTFFSTIITDGALPRKTFSMGEAHEKRFYMEARKITY